MQSCYLRPGGKELPRRPGRLASYADVADDLPSQVQHVLASVVLPLLGQDLAPLRDKVNPVGAVTVAHALVKYSNDSLRDPEHVARAVAAGRKRDHYALLDVDQWSASEDSYEVALDLSLRATAVCFCEMVSQDVLKRAIASRSSLQYSDSINEPTTLRSQMVADAMRGVGLTKTLRTHVTNNTGRDFQIKSQRSKVSAYARHFVAKKAHDQEHRSEGDPEAGTLVVGSKRSRRVARVHLQVRPEWATARDAVGWLSDEVVWDDSEVVQVPPLAREARDPIVRAPKRDGASNLADKRLLQQLRANLPRYEAKLRALAELGFPLERFSIDQRLALCLIDDGVDTPTEINRARRLIFGSDSGGREFKARLRRETAQALREMGLSAAIMLFHQLDLQSIHGEHHTDASSASSFGHTEPPFGLRIVAFLEDGLTGVAV